jgi:hypothetical protein
MPREGVRMVRGRRQWAGRVLALGVAGCLAVMSAPGAERGPEGDREAVGPAAERVLKDKVAADYGRLPLSFEANHGQSDPAVRYLARGRGYTLFLTAQEAVLVLRPPSQSTEVQPTVVRLGLAGANPAPEVVGEALRPGRVNYFRGNDPRQWRTDIPTYARVRYRAVYPGVDLVYYGNTQGALEYDFVVGPKADPGIIVLTVAGADRLEVDAAGDLILHVAGGEIRQRKPLIYQERDGVREEVAGGYVRLGPDRVGFRVEAYDAGRPLVIDPALTYSTLLGGSGGESGISIAIDTAGHAYVTGATEGPNFPTTDGAFDRTWNGSIDAFVTKLNPTGTALVYSTYLGGSRYDAGRDISVDAAGNAYVTGVTDSADFPTTPGAWDRTFASGDAFVTKLNATGSLLSYSTYLGGSSGDSANAIAVDGEGNAYVTGSTHSTDFPTTPGAFATTWNGGETDAFVTKLNPTGSGVVYSTYLGGGRGITWGFDIGTAIAVDRMGNAYVTGVTDSADFPTTPGAFDRTLGGSRDVFVTKLNPTGAQPVYSTYLGGSGQDGNFVGIAVDTAGSVYVTSLTTSTDFPTTAGAFDRTWNGSIDAFVTRLNPEGTALVYSSYLGGNGIDDTWGIAIDALGNAYVTGRTTSTDFPTTPEAFDTTANGPGDAFLTKLNPAGTGLVYSTYLGGSHNDYGSRVVVDAAGNMYVTGATGSGDFPATARFGGGGWWDVFVARFAAVIASPVIGPFRVTGVENRNCDDAPGLWTFCQHQTGKHRPGEGIHRSDDTYAWDANLSGYEDRGREVFAVAPGRVVRYAGITPPGGSYGAVLVEHSPPGVSCDVQPTKCWWSGYLHMRSIQVVEGPVRAGQILGFISNVSPDSISDHLHFVFYVGANRPGELRSFDAEFVRGYWGITTPGVYDPAGGIFYLRTSNSAGSHDVRFQYGPAGAGWIPVVGDWDGDGVDTVGLYNPATSTFYLRNSNTAGVADITFQYGPAGAGWIPVVGDWDGNGTDTVGLYNPATSTFHLRNSNTAGVADRDFLYGPPGAGWIPRVGNWDGRW